jgi:hypothetical protein
MTVSTWTRTHNGRKSTALIELDFDSGAFTYTITSGGFRISGDATSRADAGEKIERYYARTTLPTCEAAR